MTKREAIAEFNEMCPRKTFERRSSSGKVYIDGPMRDQAWNDFTDALCQDGRITQKQYSTWTHPWND